LIADLWHESSDDLYEQCGDYYNLKERVERATS